MRGARPRLRLPRRLATRRAGDDRPRDGLITINIAEADSAERERRRLELGEPYRTLLGHLRHEVGHYYWDLLVRDGGAARREPGGVRRRVRRTTSEALERLLRRRADAAGWQDGLRQRLCDHASLGGLRRDLDPLPAHGRHPRHRRELRPRRSSPRVGDDPRDTRRSSTSTPTARADFDSLIARLAAAHGRGQQPEPQHGPARPLPVRPEPDVVTKVRFIHDLLHPPRTPTGAPLAR